MYTNIRTKNRLSAFLHNPTTLTAYQHLNLNPTAITEALSLVMLNNRMRFDNIIFEQQKGIAMGMSQAPTIANLYVSIFEEQYLPPVTHAISPSSGDSLTTASGSGSRTPTQRLMN